MRGSQELRGAKVIAAFPRQEKAWCGPCGRMMVLGNAGLCLDCELIFRLAKLARIQFVRELENHRAIRGWRT